MRCSRLVKTFRFARDFLCVHLYFLFYLVVQCYLLLLAFTLDVFYPFVCPWAEKSPKTSVLNVWLIGVILVVLRRKYVLLFCSEKKRALGRTHCLKITQNVAFEFSNFGIFHQFFDLIKLTGNTVWLQAPGFQKLAKI